jgi:hypothetical protein
MRAVDPRFGILASVGLAALVASCGGRSSTDGFRDEPQCIAGQQVACACFDGTTGAQRCDENGRFGVCRCEGGDGSGASGATAGGGSGGGDATGGSGTSRGGGSGDASEPGTGGSKGGSGTGGMSGEGRRLPLPCTAPLPTGYCLVSESGDYIGGGESSEAAGEDSVQIGSFSGGAHLELQLQNSSNGDDYSADFEPPQGEELMPGLYEPATRYPFQLESVAGLSIHGNGRGCNQLTGKFAVEEIERDPMVGLVRASITFEQHCEGGTPALHGVINFQASCTPDRTPTPDRTITLNGKIFRVVYDPEADLAYGLDATNRRLAKVSLAEGTVTYADVVQVPNGACLDSERERLFVVNKGSNLITEYRTSDLSSVRDIAWDGTDWGTTDTHFEIYCSPDRLYVVDGAWAPGLFTVEGLDETSPVVNDHSEDVAGVGGLVLNEAKTNLYYWYQYGWSAGTLNTGVHRLLTSDLSEVDVTGEVPDFRRDPLEAPILLDEGRGLIFSKNKIFDATNLTRVVYSLPSAVDTFDGAGENAFALDSERGLMATKNYVYELERYEIVVPTFEPNADQLFFDASGGLWFLSVADGVLRRQLIER